MNYFILGALIFLGSLQTQADIAVDADAGSSGGGTPVTAAQAQAADVGVTKAISEITTVQSAAKLTVTQCANPALAIDAARCTRAAEKVATTTTLLTQLKSCQSGGGYAKICLTDVSPHIQTALGVVGTMLSVIQNSQTSTTDSCKSYSSGMDKLKNLLTLYNGACAAAQLNCSNSCDTSAASLKAAAAKYNMDPEDSGFKAAMASETPQSAACQSYKWNMAAAGMGLMGMITQKGKMASCEAATTVVDCTKNPYDASCAKTVDCGKSENYQNTTCICQRTPTAAGCAGYAGNTNNTPSYNGTTGDGSSSKTSAGSVGTSSSSIPVTGMSSGSGSSGSLGASGGSGSAGGGLGAGGGSGTATAAAKGTGVDAKKEKGLNTNILGGFDGGGGGGGGGSRSTASANDSAYKAYLPGGSRDPSSAKTTYANGQITGGGAKSNWEKISERYTEVKSGLNP